MISIRVQQLTKRFGDVTALDALDLTIEAGELFFLLGPSGCGKTTLLRTLAGFYLPDSGRVCFGDEDVTALAPHKRNTGMVFQSYALWPHLTVAQNVAFGLEERAVPRSEIARRVAEALASVRMTGLEERKPNELSGGQQQRVALARALVIRPRCLLLDEPLSNLDARLRLEMRAEIRNVCKQFALTTVYVTHDQKEALSIADRVAVLDRGRLLQVAEPRELYHRPRSLAVATFVGETDLLPGRLARFEAGRPVVATDVGEFVGVLGNAADVPSTGDGVTLSIRPEAWRLAGEAGPQNTVPGRIGSAVFLGEIAQYELTAGSRRLKVLELNPRVRDRREGDQVHASADPDDVIVLTR